MVKIAIVGGAGSMSNNQHGQHSLIQITDVGREVVDALLSRNKHEIIILSRKVSNQAPNKASSTYTSRVRPRRKSPLESNGSNQTTKTSMNLSRSLKESILFFLSSPFLLETRLHGPLRKTWLMQLLKLESRGWRLVNGLRKSPATWMPLVLIGSRSKLEHLPWYDFKKETRKYLAEINKDKKVRQHFSRQLKSID